MVRIHSIPLICTLVAGFIIPAFAHATLGEAPSVDHDLSAMPAQSKTAAKSTLKSTVKSAPLFTIHEVQTGSGSVREYANASGIVFGIAWSGARSPNLKTLLGTYAQDYTDASQAQARIPGRRSRSVRGKNVTVQRWGHMRNVGGRAFDPALIPDGVKIEDIQ